METETLKRPKKSQTAQILELLKTNGRATNRQLNNICFRYGARLFELRREGHIIVTNQVKDSLYEFVYKGHVEDGVKDYAD